MFSTRMHSWLAPLWSPDDEGAGGDTGSDAAASSDATNDAGAADDAKDAADTLYPDDKAKGDTDAGDDDAKDDDADSDKSEDEKSDDADDAALDLVPEDGKYNLTMPEGVEVDQELLDAVAPQFAELGLSHRDAQALTDKFIATMQAREAARGEGWANTVAGWADQAKKDPEIGGDKWDGTVKAASGVVQRFGSPALSEYLNASGAGNHPEMIRLLAKVGAAIGEDDPAISENPTGGGGKKRDAASILYPNDPPKGN